MATIFSIHFTTLIYVLMKILLCFETECILAQSRFLPTGEKNALYDIAKELGKRDWNFSLNPCDNNTNWVTPKTNDMPMSYSNTVLCNCSYPDSMCHVETIILIRQELPGVLPPSLSKLPYLKNIDFTRNYLTGTIPHEWTSLKLESMDFTVNRLSGPIPTYLGSMTSLLSLSLESNEFSGTIPPELGSLSNLSKLVLNANNLTGKLPSQLNNLKKLIQLGLSSNNLTGKLPNFRSWPALEILDLEASGLQGPLPSSMAILTSLTKLKIAYLKGRGVTQLPVLCNMTKMKRLMLRNCSISGKIPECLSNMAALQMLDLSFNNFQGEVPNLEGLVNLTRMHLTSNSLTGRIPSWIMSKINDHKVTIDLSYNDFNMSSVPTYCPENLNLYRSYRSSNPSELGRCLRQCSKDYYDSFHVNSGGTEIKIGNKVFEGDEDLSGPAKFVPNASRNWGTSSSGYFWDTQKDQSLHFVEHNVSALPLMNATELYMTARLSPLSLTYYGRCLANGTYTVTLHFAEITFRNNHSFLSLGRRIFDVYIQGEKKLEDFNIEQEANGVDTPVNRTFKVMVTDTVLEIRFQHTGKGTTAIPYRGTYGPLISAIAVKADFSRPNKRKKMMLIEIGASLIGLFLILGVISFCFWNHYIGHRIAREKELRGLDLRKGFTYRQIKAATNSFDSENKIGEGGFGCVYKGTLLDGTLIAVKQLTSNSHQGHRGFVNELGMISALHHPNLVKLYGCCIQGSDMLLVYEYMENNSLARALFGPDEHRLEMDWPTRIKICTGIAKGLAYMHEESTLKIVHRDIKAGNVLLDKDLNPKISDFGLAKLDEDEDTHISTRVAGTMGYMAPEYALWGHLTYKADVYSYGVVALEIVTGKFNTKYCPDEEFVCLLDWAFVLHTNGGLMDLVDPKLRSDELNMDEVDKVIRVALLCTSQSPALRPTMSQVVSILEGYTSVHEFNLDPTTHDDIAESYSYETHDVYRDSTDDSRATR